MPHLEVSDCVFSLQPHEWKAIVSGRIHGPFNSRGAAEAGMQTEQRREAERTAREAFNLQATAYLSLPTNAPIETVLSTLAAPATDMRYPIGDWMYEVGEGDTVLGYKEWVEHSRERDEADDERPDLVFNSKGIAVAAFGAAKAAQAPVVPAETAPLYMAALNSFWLTVHSVYPNAERVTMPQAIAQAFEVAAAGVVEAWMSAYDAGGYSDVNFGG